MSYLYVDTMFNKLEKKYFTGHNPFFVSGTSDGLGSAQSKACDAMHALRCGLNELEPMFLPEIEILEAHYGSKLDMIKLELKFEINSLYTLLMEVYIRPHGAIYVDITTDNKSKSQNSSYTISTHSLVATNVVLRQEWKKLEDFFHKVVEQGEAV